MLKYIFITVLIYCFYISSLSISKNNIFIFSKNSALAKPDKLDSIDQNDANNIDQGVRVSDFDSQFYGVWNGAKEDLIFEDDLCIFASDGSYRVNAQGSGSNKSFEIVDNNEKIEYLVYWNDVAYNAPGEIQLASRRDSIIQKTSEVTDSTCKNGTNLTGRIKIVFPFENLMGAVPGKYYGVLKISIKAL